MAFLLGLLFPDFRFHSVSFYSPLPTTRSSERSSWKLVANSGFSTRVNAMTHKRPTGAFKFPIDKLLRNLRKASRPLMRLRISVYVIGESDQRVINELRRSEEQPS